MQKFELSLTSNYVKDWTYPMAMRELIQNGIDQETAGLNSKFSVYYKDGSIFLKNTNTKLKANTLLLGRSSKQNDDSTVGQFGEGYKIAALVLTRLGKEFIIHNQGKNETWTCRFVNSKRWSERILTFFIEETDFHGEADLIIEIGNISREEYKELETYWLGFKDYQSIKTSYGEILTDEDEVNHVYVNGLYIQCSADLTYGYNFKPQYLILERDRKSCDSWDVKNLTAKMIQEAIRAGHITENAVFEMMENDNDDVSNAGYIADSDTLKESYLKKIDEKYSDDFDESVPEVKRKPIPVSNQSNYQQVIAYGGNPVLVSSSAASLVREESKKRIHDLMHYSEKKDYEFTPKERLVRWRDFYKDSLPYGSLDELNEIIDLL